MTDAPLARPCLTQADLESVESLSAAVLSRNPKVDELRACLAGWKQEGRQSDVDSLVLRCLLAKDEGRVVLHSEGLLIAEIDHRFSQSTLVQGRSVGEVPESLADLSVMACRHERSDLLKTVMALGEELMPDSLGVSSHRGLMLFRVLTIYPLPLSISVLEKMIPSVVPAEMAAESAIDALLDFSPSRHRERLLMALLDLPSGQAVDALDAQVELRLGQCSDNPMSIATLQHAALMIERARQRLDLRRQAATSSRVLASP